MAIELRDPDRATARVRTTWIRQRRNRSAYLESSALICCAQLRGKGGAILLKPAVDVALITVTRSVTQTLEER
jgi:hypothetical protein